MGNNRMSGCGPFRCNLYRDTKNGRIAGVCAGIAQHLSIDPFLVRIGAVASFFVIGPFSIMAYILAVIVLPARNGRAEMEEKIAEAATVVINVIKERAARSAEGDVFGRDRYRRPRDGAPPAGSESLDVVRERIRGMEQRVAAMEAYVASREFGLSRAIRDLEN